MTTIWNCVKLNGIFTSCNHAGTDLLYVHCGQLTQPIIGYLDVYVPTWYCVVPPQHQNEGVKLKQTNTGYDIVVVRVKKVMPSTITFSNFQSFLILKKGKWKCGALNLLNLFYLGLNIFFVSIYIVNFDFSP
jgi:hypothetical protein